MHDSVEPAFNDLFEWSRTRNFAGHDPFDALNSSLFRATPFTKSRTARLLWTQLFKRSPVSLRGVAAVPAEQNPKGIALFALAALANFRRLRTVAWEQQTRSLLRTLIEQKIDGHSGAAWGYNFDWQSRHFFAPRGTPMIVPTAFAARALVEAAETFGDSNYLALAQSVTDFIRRDLVTTVENDRELCFSYSPLDRTCVFNASLLAAETLARIGASDGKGDACELAVRAARFVVNQQRPDGSWTYGVAPNQSWIDNFHTAYVLYSLAQISKACPDASEFTTAIERGYEFWRERFFLADGWPKYYDGALYPADTHSAASAIVTLLELRTLDARALPLAEKIAGWLLQNMYAGDGRFYYQKHRFHTLRTPFMRWSQAWVAYAFARLMEVRANRSVES